MAFGGLFAFPVFLAGLTGFQRVVALFDVAVDLSVCEWSGSGAALPLASTMVLGFGVHCDRHTDGFMRVSPESPIKVLPEPRKSCSPDIHSPFPVAGWWRIKTDNYGHVQLGSFWGGNGVVGLITGHPGLKEKPHPDSFPHTIQCEDHPSRARVFLLSRLAGFQNTVGGLTHRHAHRTVTLSDPPQKDYHGSQ